MDKFWGSDWPYGPQPEPVTDADIQAWQRQFGLTLPPTLSAALQVQNGGCVWRTDLLICPLSGITPLVGERWEHLQEYGTNRSFGDPAHLILFGAYVQFPSSLILNYNAEPSPRIINLWHDLGDELRDENIGSFDDLIRSLRERQAEREQGPR